MPKNREIYEQIYKLSTEGHDKVLKNLGDIHKSILKVSEDVSFKPVGFKDMIAEAKKAKASVDDISKSMQAIPKDITSSLKKDFSEGLQSIKKDIQKESKAMSSYFEGAFSGKSIGNLQVGIQKAVKGGVTAGLEDATESSVDQIKKALASKGLEIKADDNDIGIGPKVIKEFEEIKARVDSMGEDVSDQYKSMFKRGSRLVEDLDRVNILDEKKILELTRKLEDVTDDIEDSFKKGAKEVSAELKKKLPKIVGGISGGFVGAFRMLESPDAFMQGIGKAGDLLQENGDKWSKTFMKGMDQAGDFLQEKGDKLSKIFKRDVETPKELKGKDKGISEILKKGMEIPKELRGKGALDRVKPKTGAGGGGKAAGGMADLGKMTALVGTALAAVAALGALVKLFIDADSAIKDFNKNMLDNVGAGNLVKASFLDGANAGVEFKKSMNTLYEAGSDFGFFLKTGIKSEEFASALGAMTKEGFTFSNMVTGAGDDARDLQDAVNLANIASKNFGVSLTEGASTVGDWRMNLNMSAEEVAQSFALIHKDALEAGMDTTKFFNVVRNVSADFVLFGVRAHEVSGMLELLGKSVGPKKAAEMIGGLVGQMKNMSEQDRIRMTALAGKKKSLDALRGSQQRGLKAIKDQNSSFFESSKNQDLYKKAMGGSVNALEELRKSASNTKGMDAATRKLTNLLGVEKEVKSGLVGRATGIASADLQAQIEVQFECHDS